MGAKALNEAFRNMGYCQEYTSPSFYEGKVFAISVQCVKAALCNSTLVIELCVEECKLSSFEYISIVLQNMMDSFRKFCCISQGV
jgi:hypothetical protein